MNRIEHLLAVLAEECAEVAQRCSKAQRFGFHQVQADQPLTNAQRIDRELQDLYAAVEMIRDEVGVMSTFGVSDVMAIDAKRRKVEKYMDRARDLNALDREHAKSGE